MTGRDAHDADDVLDPELAARFKLDANAGPAPRVSTQLATELVEGALAAVSVGAAAHATRSGGKGLLKTASIAGAGLVLAGAAAALYVRNAAPEEPPVPPVQATQGASAAPAVPDAVDAPAPSSGDQAALLDDMLKRANRLRASGDFAGAERLYARVFEQHPGSLAAYVARVAAASIRLDHLDDAQGARTLLRQALRERPDGALDLEVRSGLSKAERVLGGREGERAALEALVKAHPTSLAAEHARSRLRELDDGSGSSAR